MTGLVIEFEVEAAPCVRLVCMNASEELRIFDWLRTRPEYLDLVERAFELAQEARAA